MNDMTEEEAHCMLRRIGFTHIQILSFLYLRREYRANEPLDPARLEFARFLVETGRLTDQLPKPEEVAAGLSPMEIQPVLKMILAHIDMKRGQLGLPPETYFYREYH